VNITGDVQSVTISLTDSYDGDATSEINVTISSIEYCLEGGPEGPSVDGAAVVNDPSENIRGIKVYPNPANSFVNVSFKGYDKVEGRVEMFNFHGQLVLSKEIKSSNLNQIDVTNLADGLYVLMVKDLKGSTLVAKKIAIKL
ncbi:MAG: T9SS type A sorting domain-containing protein, partial [Flavobacteriaceae bacterium]|nr:T9SS type A sorting domain-containing protein [Flavobacteriaceae bacterium]